MMMMMMMMMMWWWWNSCTKHIVAVHIIHHVWIFRMMDDSVYICSYRSQQWRLLVLCRGRVALEGTTTAAAKLPSCDHLQQTIPRLIRLAFSLAFLEVSVPGWDGWLNCLFDPDIVTPVLLLSRCRPMILLLARLVRSRSQFLDHTMRMLPTIVFELL